MRGTPATSGVLRLRAFVCLAAAVMLALPSAAFAANVVLRDVSLGEYPLVSVDVALTADLVPQTGEPAFTVMENGIEARGVTAQVATQDRPPLDVVLLVDVSGSMRDAPLAGAKNAAKRFVSAMRATDRVAIVAFSDEPRAVLGFTSDAAALMRAIDSLQASGETALHDGLIVAARAFAPDERDRAIVVLSDGGDTTSINTLDAAARTVSSAQAPVYAVALSSPEYNPAALQQLSTRTGGRFVTAEAAEGLVGIFEEIALELRNLYTVTFESARPSTKDLEIELVATNGNVTGALTTAIENPRYAEAPVSAPTQVQEETLADRAGRIAIAFLVFGAVVLAVYLAGLMLLPHGNALRQLEYYGQYQDSGDNVPEAVPLGRARVMKVVAAFAEERGFTEMARAGLERAGLPLRPNEYIFFHVLAAGAVTMLVHLVGRNLFVTVLIAILMVFGPILLIRMKIDRRKARFDEQLPDVLSLIAGSLRAGWGIQQGLDLVIEEISEPAASEFRRVQSESRFGLPLEQALSRMAERLDSDDFRWTVTAIAIQREVGGNLAEVLDIVATTIRTRAELRRHVKALTAESRYSAVALAIMPFVIVAALAVVNPIYLAPLFTSPIGWGAMIVGLILLTVGTAWIMKLTKLEV